MGTNWGIAFRWACTAGLLVGIAFATPAAAQSSADDAAAREYFEAGRAAFNRADYESALTYFRHAYRASGRGSLQYNIGLVADRLRRDREALEAFERYLEEAETVTRETEVRRRIDTLKKSLAGKEAAERALLAAKLRAEEAASSGKRRGRRGSAAANEEELDLSPAPADLPEPASRSAVTVQLPEYKTASDEPTAKKKKWPWIVAAVGVVVVGGVTAGVVLSQRSGQSSQPEGGFTVSW